jgi:hypothetical protein
MQQLSTDPQGSGGQRPSFSVPRLRRGVHRPAAAALRSGAGVVVGRQGFSPAAAVPPLSQAKGEGLGCLGSRSSTSRGCAAGD